MNKSHRAGSSKAPIIKTTVKPFCNCKNCTDLKCPNLMDSVPFPPRAPSRKKVKETAKSHECESVIQAKLERGIPCSLADKSKCAKQAPKVPPLKPKLPRLIDELKLPGHFKGCGCVGIAHALGKHLHMNLGMAHKREIINGWRRRSSQLQSSITTLYKQESTTDGGSYPKNSK